jgi:hypothetical protein
MEENRIRFSSIFYLKTLLYKTNPIQLEDLRFTFCNDIPAIKGQYLS